MGEPYYIGGQLTHSPNTIPVIFPYTGEVFAEVCIASVDDQARAADCAMRGFAETRILPVHRRAAILRDIADKIEEHRGEFVHTLVYESGKPARQAHLEVTRAVSVMRISAEESVRITGKVIPMDDTERGEGYTGYYYQVPSGPVLYITPFNYPLNLACHKIGPAIAAWCSFVLKPSSKTPFFALLLARLILEVGYPANAVNVVPCFGSNAETLVRDPRFTMLSFTGSPAVVHKDADIAYAARRIVEGAVINAGQSCYQCAACVSAYRYLCVSRADSG